jgi:hypothetical protein
MTSTTSNNLSAYYTRTASQLYVILGTILMGIGSVGTVLCCIVFAQKTMRKNPVAIYFIAFNVANLFILLLALLPSVLLNITHFDPSVYNVPYCKIEYYFRFICPALSRYYLVLAAIDRTAVTSPNALTRQQSTLRLAYRSIAGVTSVVLLYFIHLLVGVNIYQLSPGYFLCYYQPGDYTSFIVYSTIVVNNFFPSLLLSVFAMLTLKNLRRVRIQPLNTALTGLHTYRSKDRQLAVMLLLEIIIYILFSSMSFGLSIYQQITQYQTKSVQQKLLEQFLQSVFYIFTFVTPATNFYLNVAVSKVFRQKAIQLLFKICQHRPIEGGTRQAATRA